MATDIHLIVEKRTNDGWILRQLLIRMNRVLRMNAAVGHDKRGKGSTSTFTLLRDLHDAAGNQVLDCLESGHIAVVTDSAGAKRMGHVCAAVGHKREP
jgi:hypothetical protein